MKQTGWYEDPENPKRLRFKIDDVWTLRVKYFSGTEAEYETELAEPLNRGKVNIDSSAYKENNKDFPKLYVNPTSKNATQGQNHSKQSTKSAKKWLLGISISLAIIYLFNSCQTSGWQIGVDGNGTRVECNDGTWSNSGGLPGACSWHDGVK